MDNQTLVSENVAPYSSRFIPHSQSKISTTANSTNKPTDETIIRDYHKKLQTLSFHPGELQRKDNIGRISQNGVYFVVNDKFIYLRQLKWI